MSDYGAIMISLTDTLLQDDVLCLIEDFHGDFNPYDTVENHEAIISQHFEHYFNFVEIRPCTYKKISDTQYEGEWCLYRFECKGLTLYASFCEGMESLYMSDEQLEDYLETSALAAAGYDFQQ